MVAPVPQTLAHSISVQITSIRSAGCRYGESEALIQELMVDVLRLKKVDQIAAIGLEGSLEILLGRTEQGLKQCFNAARASGWDSVRTINYCQNLLQVGQFSKARLVLAERLKSFDLDSAFESYKVGASALLGSVCDHGVEKLKTVGLLERYGQVIRAMANVESYLKELGVNPDSVVRMLDIAGEVAARNKLLLHVRPLISIDRGSELVWYHLPLPIGVKEVAQLSNEFQDALFEKYPEAPIKHVHVDFCYC